MTVHLVLLVVYSVGVVALGLWAARLVRHSSEFFVAGRTLGPGLIFATMLAANIGAGSTVGAAGVAYRDGISAWWWVGSALLAGQLIAGAAILNVVAGIPRWAGALIGGAVMTIYFSAGGLLGSAWVNSVQLAVMVAGFLAALPFVLGPGGFAGLTTSPQAPAWFGDFLYSGGPLSGWTFLVLLGPSFLISPG